MAQEPQRVGHLKLLPEHVLLQQGGGTQANVYDEDARGGGGGLGADEQLAGQFADGLALADDPADTGAPLGAGGADGQGVLGGALQLEDEALAFDENGEELEAGVLPPWACSFCGICDPNHTPNDHRTTTARTIFVVNAFRSAPKSRAASSADRPDSRRPRARTLALLECNWAVLETRPQLSFKGRWW